jgi:hypothetical protein
MHRSLSWRGELPYSRAGVSDQRRILVPLLIVTALEFSPAAADTAPKVGDIVRRWGAAMQADFEAAPHYSYRETIRNGDGIRTYEVTMLAGSPYKRLLSAGGKPLSDEDRRSEDRKFEEERRKRAAESADDRAKRLADYQKDREHAHRILREIPRAFTFRLRSARQVPRHRVYVLDAAPRPGYDPPTVEAKVLTGMRGEFWIDASAFQLVRGTARVLEPVSIGGFLAKIQPGTEFVIEEQPLDVGVWLPTRFVIRSHSSILFLFHHHVSEERTYFDYTRVGN